MKANKQKQRGLKVRALQNLGGWTALIVTQFLEYGLENANGYDLRAAEPIVQADEAVLARKAVEAMYEPNNEP